jgi:hypothetical protein
MGLREKVEAKRQAERQQQTEQQDPAPKPASMSEVQSPGIAKAEKALEDYREAQKPQADEDDEEDEGDEDAEDAEGSQESAVEPPVIATFPGGRILEGGIVVHDKASPRVVKEALTITRGETTTDEQWQELKGWLTAKGVKFQAGKPK